MSELPTLNFSNFVMKYLGKIETEFKKTLACLSGTQMGSNHEKKEVKNLMTHFLLNNDKVVKVASGLTIFLN